MKTNLEALLQNLETARKGATQGKWERIEHHQLHRATTVDCGGLYVATCAKDTEGMGSMDARFIAESANHILQLIEIIRVQKWALDKIGVGKIKSDMDNAQIMAGRMWQTAQSCNAKVEEIAKGSK